MTIPPHSFSSLNKFETCPRQYYLLKVVKKVKEPPTESTIWGNAVHKAFEHRIKDKTPLPKEMAKWEPILAPLDYEPQVAVEQRVMLTRNLEPTESWKDAWVRGIVDLGVDRGKTALIADWKTGKVKPSSQLSLSSAMWFAHKPWIERIKTAFFWLAYKDKTVETIRKEDTAEIWKDFTSRAQRLENAYDRDRWVPRPSGLCNGWCPVGKEHCEFWQPKRNK